MAQLASAVSFPLRFHRAWIILAILIVVQVIGQAISMSAGIMVPLLKDQEGDFGWNMATIGGAIALYYLVGALMSPVAGMMGDRFGARPIMFACGVLYLVSMLLVGMVSQVWHFFIAFGVFLAITQAFTFVPLQASIGGWFRRRLGLATGVLQAAGGIGSALLAPGVASLLEWVGWQSTFWYIAFVGGGLIILCSLFFRSKPADTGIRAYGTSSDDPPEVSLSKEVLKARLKVFGQHMRRTRAFWNLPTIHGLGCAGHGIVLIYSVPLAIDLGFGLTEAAFILTFISVFSIVGRFVVPILAERMGGKPVMMVSLFVQGITVIVLFFAHDPWTFYLFGALFGLGFGGEMSAYLVVNRQYFGPGPLATLYGFEIMGAMMGHAVATGLGGLVIYLTGLYQPVLALSMGFSIVGVLVILTLEPTKRVLIPNWEDDLPPEVRSDAIYRLPAEPPPAFSGGIPEATPGD
jgi:MFS family permease